MSAGEEATPNGAITSIDDLLTDEEREQLASDLRRIHDALHPCWHREPPRPVQEKNP